MDFLVRFFVKDYPAEVSNPEIRTKCGKVTGLVGIVSNILLFAIKLFAGIFAGSVAMTADAINNLADSASSIITAVGFKMSEKPADDKHPFGHARMEYLAGMIVSFFIVFVGFQLGTTSLEKIITPQDTNFTPIVFAILILSILIKIWQSLFYQKVSKVLSSATLEATAQDSRNDVISTTVILIGAIITSLTSFNLDGYLGLAVAVFILISGGKLILETADPLLGTAPDKELYQKIMDKVLSYEGILGAHDLTIHNYGAGRCFASVHCEVSATEDILKSHDVIDNIERDFSHELGIQLVIHLDPVVTDDERTNELKRNLVEKIGEIYPEASIHDFRVVWGITHTNVLFDVVLPFSEKDAESIVREKIEKLLTDMSPDFRVFIVVDRVSATMIKSKK